MRWWLPGLVAAISLSVSPAQAVVRIAVVGDSYASGEGNPDGEASNCLPTPGPGGGSRACRIFDSWGGRNGRAATAADTACHRSTAAGLLRAAEQIRSDLAALGEPVIVETFACSGATTATVGHATTPAFSGQYPGGGTVVASQLSLLATDSQFADAGTGLATGDRIDAIVMSVGANDIGFGAIVTSCALDPRDECYRIQSLTALIGSLPGLYATLNSDIASTLGTRVGNIFIMEYHNPSVGPDGPCGATTAIDGGRPFVRPPDFGDVPLFWGMSYYESRFASEVLVPALNAAVANGAAANGWRFVGGVAGRFPGHGHCARDRWVRNLNDSFSLQGGPWGVVHPNRTGHEVIRDAALAALAPYREVLTPPAGIRFGSPLFAQTELAASGGQGPFRQFALLELPSAQPSAAVPPPPGFAGDGARQRVSLDPRGLSASLGQASGATGSVWNLRETDAGTSAQAAGDRHWVIAARSCNVLRCSGWTPAAVTPAVAPRDANVVSLSGALLPTWTAHRRDGVYQVAVPTGVGRWDVFEVIATGSSPISLIASQAASHTAWSEIGPRPAGRPDVLWQRDRPQMIPQGTRPSTFAQVMEFYVRGCNQAGCSAWTTGADFVNALRTPSPGPFSVVISPLPCTVRNGQVNCPTGDQGRRASAWDPVPGANTYQVIAFGPGGAQTAFATDQPAAVLDSARQTGLRARACNAAGCSAWSAPAMLTPGAVAPAPPPNLGPPPNLSHATARGAPPQSLPNSIL